MTLRRREEDAEEGEDRRSARSEGGRRKLRRQEGTEREAGKGD
jgi:hypothetical protein